MFAWQAHYLLMPVVHHKPQNPKYPDEHASSDSGWICGLAQALQEKLGDGQKMLFKKADTVDSDHQITAIGEKLDRLAKALKLHSYDNHGQFKGKLKPISYASIQPVQVICPNAVACETMTRNPCSLVQITKVRDIPYLLYCICLRNQSRTSGWSCYK